MIIYAVCTMEYDNWGGFAYGEVIKAFRNESDAYGWCRQNRMELGGGWPRYGIQKIEVL